MNRIQRYALHLIAILTLVFAAAPATAQESINREAFYNNADGFHVLIPAGWDNLSNEQYAHFVQPDTQVNIYADAALTTDLQAGITEVLAEIDAALNSPPAETTRVNLPNGEWTQNLYDLEGDASLTAYGQVYDAMTYVFVWYSTASAAQPVIVPDGDLAQAVTDGIELLGYTPADAAVTDDVSVGGQTWTRSVYEGDSLLTIVARAREASTLMIVKPGEPADSDTALPAFFALLTGFFITPATAPYLYLGYGVTALITVIFLGMLVIRHRSLRKDVEMLAMLQPE